MLAFRYFVVVSVGTAMALGHGVSATAEDLSTVRRSSSETTEAQLSSPSAPDHPRIVRKQKPSAQERVDYTTEVEAAEPQSSSPGASDSVATSSDFAVIFIHDIDPVALNLSRDEWGTVTPVAQSSPPPDPGTSSVEVSPQDTATVDPSSEASTPLTAEAETAPTVAQESPPAVAPVQTNDGINTLQDEVTSPDSQLSIPIPAPVPNAEDIVNEADVLREPEPTPVELSTLERLAPSSNPLLFPTEPSEVTVDLTQPITLEDAIALAQQNNQQLRSARLTLEKSQMQLRAALASWYPNLDLNMNFGRTDSPSGELQNRIRRNSPTGNLLGENSTITDSFDASLDLVYSLYNGGRRNAQIRQAEEQIRLNRLEVERVGEEIRLSATNAYYSLQEADATVGIEQAAVEQAKQTLRDAELLEQAGLGTRFDVLRAQVELANSNQALTRALSSQKIARRQLVQVLAVGQKVELTIADAIRPAGQWDLSLEETIVLAYKNRAELEQQLIQRDINEQQRRVALADTRPQVNLRAGYNVLGVIDDGEGLADGYTLRAELRWRLFDGGLAKANSRAEELDIQIAEVEFERQRNEIRVEVEESFSNLQANGENIKTAAVAVQLAEESLRLARLRFQAGVGTQTDVIDAQTELTRARGNLLTAIITYNRALAALQRAVSNYPDNRLFDLP